jgi:hypothetical protein
VTFSSSSLHDTAFAPSLLQVCSPLQRLMSPLHVLDKNFFTSDETINLWSYGGTVLSSNFTTTTKEIYASPGMDTTKDIQVKSLVNITRIHIFLLVISSASQWATPRWDPTKISRSCSLWMLEVIFILGLTPASEGRNQSRALDPFTNRVFSTPRSRHIARNSKRLWSFVLHFCLLNLFNIMFVQCLLKTYSSRR